MNDEPMSLVPRATILGLSLGKDKTSPGEMAYRQRRSENPTMFYDMYMWSTSFELEDTHDAGAFLLGAYLSGNRAVVNYITNGRVTVTMSSALQAYPAVVARAREIFRTIPQDTWETPELDFTDEQLLALRELLLLPRNPNGNQWLDYGYLRFLRTEDKYWLSPIPRAVTSLLRMGVNPNGLDRWGRPLHVIVNLTPIQWRTVIFGYNYPICDPVFTQHLGEGNVVHEAPLAAIAKSALSYELTGLILTEDELLQRLTGEDACGDNRYIATMRHHIGELLDVTSTENVVAYEQLRILFRGLTRFYTKPLMEITLLPPSEEENGVFPGGVHYREAMERFTQRDY